MKLVFSSGHYGVGFLLHSLIHFGSFLFIVYQFTSKIFEVFLPLKFLTTHFKIFSFTWILVTSIYVVVLC